MRTLLILLLGLTTGFGERLVPSATPLGTRERPLILRTFMPDPGLEPGVFVNHGKAAKASKYRPKEGNDTEGEYEMTKIIPAAIAVSHGRRLSYVWDTTECRLLYAWQGGFLDLYGTMAKEGKEGSGPPRLVGNLFYLAQPAERAKPQFLGYQLSKTGIPTFQFRLGAAEYAQTIEPVNRSYTFKITTSRGERSDRTTYTGELLSRHGGYERDLKIKKATAKVGQEVFQAYGCAGCHSVDGSERHGPSLAGLFGSTRQLVGADPVLADESYLKESIAKPDAKTAEGFLPGYMAPYNLNDQEIGSLILYLKSLAK